MKKLKKLLSAAVALAVSLTAAVSVSAIDVDTSEIPQGSTVILYTNDVHNAYEYDETSGAIGYAAAAAYMKQLQSEGYEVILIDAGDAIQGGIIGTLSDGEYLVDIMEATGYSIAVPGNHEFDYGMENFLTLAENAEYEYICCNFVDLRTGETVFDPYKTVNINGKNIAFVGICTPESLTKSTPIYFQDENGEYIYGFCQGNNGQNLYDQVQNAVDAARADGADYVIAVGHTGVDSSSAPYTTGLIISNTSGIDAYIDGHSHTVMESGRYENKDGEEVLVTQTGSKFINLGQMVIAPDGEISSKLISFSAFAEEDQDEETLDFVNEITAQFYELTSEVVAESEINLVVNDPDDGTRIIRNQETNLGDLCADAYRYFAQADIAFVNGGGIRAEINIGDITYGDIISIHPFCNELCIVEATGQQILDALEMGSRFAESDELGGFLQVSGLTYEIDTTIPSSVVLDDEQSFVKVDGEYRVQNVTVGGEPLELDKTYKLASHNYMLKFGGDGYTMFLEDTLLVDGMMVDNQVLIHYIIDALDGVISEDGIYADPYGEGRIKVILEKKDATDTEDGYMVIAKGTGTETVVIPAVGSADDSSNEAPDDDSAGDVNNDAGNADDKAVQTGNTAESVIMLSVMAFASAAVIAADKIRRRK